MRSVYSSDFKPHMKHVIELLELIQSGRNTFQKLKVKSKLSPSKLADYLAYARLTYVVEGNWRMFRQVSTKAGPCVSFGDLERSVTCSFTLTPIGKELLQAYKAWQGTLDLPSFEFEKKAMPARIRLETACNAVREHPDYIGDKLAPNNLSLSTLHPEF